MRNLMAKFICLINYLVQLKSSFKTFYKLCTVPLPTLLQNLFTISKSSCLYGIN